MVAGGTHPVVCLDEVEELISRASVFSRDFFLALRSLGQNGLSLITAGRRPLSEMMDASDTEVSPFYNTFPLLRLGPFRRRMPTISSPWPGRACRRLPRLSGVRSWTLRAAIRWPCSRRATGCWMARSHGSMNVHAAIRAANEDMRAYLPALGVAHAMIAYVRWSLWQFYLLVFWPSRFRAGGRGSAETSADASVAGHVPAEDASLADCLRRSGESDRGSSLPVFQP